MTMTLTCNGDCNHQQQSQCNAHTAMTMAMTCNGDYNHTAMTMTLIMTHSGMTTVCTGDYDPQGHNGLQKCAWFNMSVPETFDASAIQTLQI